MKALYYISVVVVIALSSCNSALYTGAEYDDLYYQPSDRPLSEVRPSTNKQINEGTLKADIYYDNIYAADTLVSDQYSDAVDYDNAIASNDYNNGTYDYYDNYSYSGRLRRFYGNYFDPYWRDPFYSGMYSPFSYSFGYGGFPYSYGYSPFSYDPFYSDYYGGYYGGGYGGGYYGGGYMGGLYNPYFYGSYYNSFYSPYGYYSGIGYRDGANSVTYGRRERQSNLSSRWNSMAGSGSSGRDSYLSTGGSSNVTRRSSATSQPTSSDSRRTYTGVNAQKPVNVADSKSVQYNNSNTRNATSREVSSRNSTSSRPEYNSTNRTYTPTYSNPRISTRPSYNNSRVSDGTNSMENQNSRFVNPGRSNSNINQSRTNTNQSYNRSQNNSVRNTPSVPSGQTRSVSTYRSPGSYSTPARRSAESGSGFSSGSSNSRSSSSYSGGSYSSGSESRGSYSSGSSSSGSSSGSSSSSSSGGRRR